jgi:FkbM family methyltransferase
MRAQEVMVLDIGAGSGLLSMMAARAGADTVVAVEQSSHMCEVAEKAIAANELSSKCIVLQRDARRMFAADERGSARRAQARWRGAGAGAQGRHHWCSRSSILVSSARARCI